MTKIKFVIGCIMVVLISAICFYFNYDDIVSYFENKKWEIADSIGSVNLNNSLEIEGTFSNLIVIGSNYIKGYSSDAKEKFDIFALFQEVVADSEGDYCIIGEKNGTQVYMICGAEKVWESSITGSIYDVYVNKNGYAAIIYKQSGYKSLIKILSPNGSELFTSYFASTYALDVSISNDNKALAIAEVDTEGIHITSAIKIIDINNLENSNIKKYDLDNGCLLVDIEYNDKNELLIKTDSKIEILSQGIINEVLTYDYSNTINASIENKKNVILIKKKETGLFDTKYNLEIYSIGDKIEKIEYELYDLPKQVKTISNIVALVMEDEILIINTNGKLVKKFDSSRNIKSIALYDNGGMAGLIFRDKIEFIKL